MNKSFKHYELIDDENGGGVRAYFADGSVYEGQYLIGCEGAASNGELLLSTVPYPYFPSASRLSALHIVPAIVLP